MTRPWIEFVQCQELPWVGDDLAGWAPGAAIKLLSRDGETGASSLLVRYPAGFAGPSGARAAAVEMLVLEGDLTVGEARFAPFSYGRWPAGHDAGERRSGRGAIALTFLSAVPEAAATVPVDPAGLVPHLDALHVPYTGNFHPEFPPGAGRKLLWTCPESGNTSWLLGTLPLRWADRAEVHPVVEEMFLLAGESHGNRGVMKPGAYFWRPAGIPHGPYGTLTGNLYFFRTEGGPLRTDYVDGGRFQWHPPHAPVLPDTMVAAGSPVTTPPRW